ncbi:FAD-dependent oxidoreductase, partial [Flavobacteriaceae bacterium]|nr:FAD-dependent oxidoreductase [Flavobacteriaceae bacterium]
MEHIVIIGNGISGVTAARHIRKLSDKKITLVSAETDYFFSRTALMYVFMGHMKFEHTQPYENWFWEKNKIELKKGFVHTIETKHNILYFDNGETLKYDKLIIATGSKPNKFGWPGQDLKGVLGMYHKQDLESLETYAPNNKVCQRAVIVGGGLIGIELAEMLHSRQIPVTFLVREASFWNGVLPQEESAIINREILSNGIDLRLSTNLKEIISDEIGQVKSVII